MRGKLNIFQRTMLQWNGLHPYNAVHVVRVPQPLEMNRLRLMINREMEQFGLTGFSLDKRKGAFQYQGGPVQNEIRMIPVDQGPQSALQKEMEAQLNAPFRDHGDIHPFRFFVIQEEGAFYLGLTYFHVVAGAESIILLLKHFVNKYMGQEPPGFRIPLDVYPKGYGALMPRSPQLVLQKFSSVPSMVRILRRSSRLPFHDFRDQSNGISVFSLSSDELQKLLRVGKHWRVTLNDLFLALLLQSLSPFALKRFSASRRRQMTVGSIVNIRRDLGIDSLKTFGLFLGSFVVSHGVPEGISTEQLSREIQQQTLRIKEEKLYLATPIELWVGRLLLSCQSPEHQKSFFPKYYPLWGGITNMNLNPLWEQHDATRPIDYFRAVSTGPITPLVLSVTTVGDVVNIGLTFKKTVFSLSEIERLISDFRNAINHLEVRP